MKKMKCLKNKQTRTQVISSFFMFLMISLCHNTRTQDIICKSWLHCLCDIDHIFENVLFFFCSILFTLQLRCFICLLSQLRKYKQGLLQLQKIEQRNTFHSITAGQCLILDKTDRILQYLVSNQCKAGSNTCICSVQFSSLHKPQECNY